MNTIHRERLYDLLRIALRLPEPEGWERRFLSMGGNDWKTLITLSREQAVNGLVYDALRLVDGRVTLPEETSLELMLDASRISLRTRRLCRETEQVCATLSKAGFHPVVMKGASLAAMYPEPDLRISGDIDLYILPKELPEACRILNRQYGQGQPAPDGSFHYSVNGTDLDIHTRYYDLSMSSEALPDVFSPQGCLLMLSCHILKHALGTGVGLRQLCDLAMAIRYYSGKYDPDNMADIFRSTGTFRWNRMLDAMLNARLSISSGIFPGNGKVSFRPLERIVFAGGNFGHYAKTRNKVISGNTYLRKADTAIHFLRNMPFALYYSPHEYFLRITQLVKGNL